MNYIGNYKDWIDPNWISLLLNQKGQARPQEWPLINTVESDHYANFIKAGYDLNTVLWWIYEKEDLNIDITPPWTKGIIHWWFTKMYPGQYMPMHTDPHTHDQPCTRYWIPLQDYTSGHIFIINDQLIAEYNKGDVFEFDDSKDIHGAANLSQSVRCSLLITEYY